MKRLWILFLVLIPCLPAFTLNLGFAADVGVGSNSVKEDASKASAFNMALTPAVVLMMSPKVEVRPFVTLGMTKYSDPDSFSGYPDDYSRFNLGLGAGLYYHFIQKEILELSIGPKLAVDFYFKPTGTSAPTYTTYSNIVLALTLPVNLDFKLTKKLFLRTGIEIQGLQYDSESYTQGGVKYTYSYFSFVDFETGFNPYFGFYYML